jgi:hypothetical protein
VVDGPMIPQIKGRINSQLVQVTMFFDNRIARHGLHLRFDTLADHFAHCRLKSIKKSFQVTL